MRSKYYPPRDCSVSIHFSMMEADALYKTLSKRKNKTQEEFQLLRLLQHALNGDDSASLDEAINKAMEDPHW